MNSVIFKGPDKRKSERHADTRVRSDVSVSSVHISLSAVLNSGCADIYARWDACRGDRFAPSWQDLDLSSLSSNQIRYTHMVDVTAVPFDIVFRFWGTGLTNVLNFDRTGQSLLTTDMGYLEEARRTQVLSDYRDVLVKRTPMPFLWDASVTRMYGQRLIVPSIRLPLSSDGCSVTNIVTHFDFASQDQEIWEEMFGVHDRNI